MYVFVHVYESLYKLINSYNKLDPQTKFFGYALMRNHQNRIYVELLVEL